MGIQGIPLALRDFNHFNPADNNDPLALSIAEESGMNEAAMDQLERSIQYGVDAAGIDHNLDGVELTSLLLYVGAVHRGRLAFVNPQLIAQYYIPLTARDGTEIPRQEFRAADATFGNVDRAEYVAIPIPKYIPDESGIINYRQRAGHWVLGMLERRSGIVYYYDSLPMQMPIDDERKRMIRMVVETLLFDDNNQPMLQLRDIVQRRVPFDLCQDDGVSCGFFLLLYVEMHVLHGNNWVIERSIPNFNTEQLRQRLYGFLYDIWERHYPRYVEPASAQAAIPTRVIPPVVPSLSTQDDEVENAGTSTVRAPSGGPKRMAPPVARGTDRERGKPKKANTLESRMLLG